MRDQLLRLASVERLFLGDTREWRDLDASLAIVSGKSDLKHLSVDLALSEEEKTDAMFKALPSTLESLEVGVSLCTNQISLEMQTLQFEILIKF
jgi:hypothetical protein